MSETGHEYSATDLAQSFNSASHCTNSTSPTRQVLPNQGSSRRRRRGHLSGPKLTALHEDFKRIMPYLASTVTGVVEDLNELFAGVG